MVCAREVIEHGHRSGESTVPLGVTLTYSLL